MENFKNFQSAMLDLQRYPLNTLNFLLFYSLKISYFFPGIAYNIIKHALIAICKNASNRLISFFFIFTFIKLLGLRKKLNVNFLIPLFLQTSFLNANFYYLIQPSSLFQKHQGQLINILYRQSRCHSSRIYILKNRIFLRNLN